jgi:hypothetical protein
MYLQHYIIVISLVQKERDHSEEDQSHPDRGTQGEFRNGKQPQGENYPFPLMSKGER